MYILAMLEGERSWMANGKVISGPPAERLSLVPFPFLYPSTHHSLYAQFLIDIDLNFYFLPQDITAILQIILFGCEILYPLNPVESCINL